MAANFDDFLAWPERDTVILAEVTPTLVLSGFAAVGGATPNVYSIAMPRSVQSTVIIGGLTRRCVGVIENATRLTERASVAVVNSNAGSFYWDESAEVLYVHSTTGSDPDLFTTYQALVTFYFATKGIILNLTDGDPSTGIYYQPWLSNELPTITSEVEDVFFGQKNLATGTIKILNKFGVLNTLLAPDGDYRWKNKRVAFFFGGSYNGLALARSQYVAITTMLIDDVAPDEFDASLQLKPLMRQLSLQVPPTPYFESAYANMGDGVRGTTKWIGYGRTTMRPDLTDTTVSSGRWTIADADYQTLFAVHSVAAVNKANGVRTVLTETTHYTVDLTLCTLTVTDPTYAYQNYDIEIDVTGKPDGAGSYIKTFGTIVPDMLTSFAGVSEDDIDAAAFAGCDADAPDELSVWIKNRRSLSSILSTSEPGFPSLERSVMGTVQQTLSGLWTAWIWDPGYDSSALLSLTKSDFKTFKPQPKLETIFATTRVRFNFNHGTQTFSIEKAEDPAVAYENEIDQALDVFTFLRSAGDAETLAQRYQFISGSVSTEIEFELRRPLLAEHLAGDKVLITYDPAPAASGSYASRAFEILRLGKAYAPIMTVVGRFGDLRGIGARIGHWKDDTAAPWATATDAEKSVAGFWTNDAGLVDPSDPLTEGISVWW